MQENKLSVESAVALGMALGSLYGSSGHRLTRQVGKNHKANPVKKKKRKAQRLARRVNRG